MTKEMARHPFGCRSKWHGIAVATALSLGLVEAVSAQTPKPLSANDVSILFPAPTSENDLANLIGLAELPGGPQKEPLLSKADFDRIREVAQSTDSLIDGTSFQIKLQSGTEDIAAWFIAAIRIDPGAPGVSPEIIAEFGQQPQVRFVAQPVLRTGNGQVKVLDTAVHLIFGFSSAGAPIHPGCLPKTSPDAEAFNAVVRDIAGLRDNLATGAFGVSVDTSDKALGVHPAFADPATGKAFTAAIKALIENRLNPSRLGTSAVMGLANGGPQPWIFVPMVKFPGIGFTAIPGPTLDGKQKAEALVVGGGPVVQPAPKTNNLNPITCRNAFAFPPGQFPPLPATDRNGVATADFLNTSGVSVDRANEIVDIIADTRKSHFFNTDCVSCHTDTRRALDHVKAVTAGKLDPAVLPGGDWNVRNFGWFGGSPTATRRVAAETADSVQFINANLLSK
jgi:hypothetical protein